MQYTVSAGGCLACGPTGHADLLIDKTCSFISRPDTFPAQWWRWRWSWSSKSSKNKNKIEIKSSEEKIINKNRHNKILTGPTPCPQNGDDEDHYDHNHQHCYASRMTALKRGMLMMFLTVGQNWHMPGLDFWPGLNLLLMLGTASDDAQSGISSMEPVAWQKYTTGTLLGWYLGFLCLWL